jgi:phosphonate C-P lyase system protein PhnG
VSPDPAQATRERVRALQALSAAIDEGEAERALAALGVEGLEVARAPRPALAMLRATDPFDTTFCLGEARITEAAVRRGDARGWGAVVGEAPQRALLSAVADLLGREGDREALAALEALLEGPRARLAEARAAEARLVASTRVQFDLMPSR